MLAAFLSAGLTLLLMALAGWAYGVRRHNVNVVDSLWPLFFLAATLWYAAAAPGARAWLMLGLVTTWSLRLAVHLGARNFGQPEDHRYRAIRSNHEPHFAIKSLYLVFGLQALLAWVISAPLLAATAAPAAPLGLLDLAGAASWALGMFFQGVGDWQLRRFQRDPAHRGQVLDEGLWRYTRHPNYFGEFCIWWGYFLIAAAAGGWWSVFSPLIVTFLLLRVSGVALMERDIAERRPGYRDYARSTNAFFPGPRRPQAVPEGNR